MKKRALKFLAFLVAIVSLSSFSVFADSSDYHDNEVYTGAKIFEGEGYGTGGLPRTVYFYDNLSVAPVGIITARYITFTFQNDVRSLTFHATGVLVTSMYIGMQDLDGTGPERNQYTIYTFTNGAAQQTGLLAGSQYVPGVDPYVDYYGIIGLRLPDTTPPVIAPHADVIVEATSTSGTPAVFTPPQATDPSVYAVPQIIPASSFDAACLPASGSLFPLGSTTVTCTAQDSAGNQAAATFFEVIVKDTTIPEFTTLPTDKSFEATAVDTPVALADLGPVTVTDIFGATLISDAPAVFPYGDTPVTWMATDGNGLVNTAVQRISIVDTTLPVFLTVPGPVLTEATAVETPLADVDLGAADASDIFGVTITNDAPAVFPLGSTTVTWTAVDGHGLSQTATQLVTLVDTTNPVFTFVPPDKTVEATAVDTPFADTNIGTGSDIFGTSITNNAPATFPFGPTIVTWTVTDANNLQSTADQVITIVDTTAPVFTLLPTDIVVEATAVATPLADVDLGIPAATDIFGAAVTNDAPSVFPYGQTIVTWTATDGHGLTKTAEQIVTIVDTTAPVFSFVPADMTGVASGSVNIGTAVATDIFGASISNNAPVTFPVGETVVTWTATDSNGLKSTANQVITIEAAPTATPTAAPTAAPTSIPATEDVLGAGRGTTATPAAAALGAAKTGETDNQMGIQIGIALLLVFGAVSAVYVIRRKKIED